jgi:hypothetical protein
MSVRTDHGGWISGPCLDVPIIDSASWELLMVIRDLLITEPADTRGHTVAASLRSLLLTSPDGDVPQRDAVLVADIIRRAYPEALHTTPPRS